jgi:glycosyltransferase involved in cell wall biosynthesis
MKVVVVAPWGQRLGGAEQALWTMLRAFDPADVQASVVFLGPGEFVDEVAALGIRSEVVPAGRLRHGPQTMRTVARLARVFRRERADVVLNWSAKAHIYGGPAAVLAGVGRHVAWWQHAIPEHHWVDRAATALPTRVVVCCSNASSAAQQRHAPKRRTAVVHAGIETPTSFMPGSALRAELGVPEDRTVVGIVGRLQPWKGQHHVIRAVAELARRGHDVHGLVIGGAAFGLSPEYEPELHVLAREEGVVDRVTFAGQLPDAARYLAAMDILVNASKPEPYGLVLLEAMAAGVPTVAYATGGPLDIVVDGVTGLLVPPERLVALADAVEALVVDPEMRERFGEAGRVRVSEVFTPGRAADELVRLLIEVASR